MARLRRLTAAPLIKAFSIESREDAKRAAGFGADYILLDQAGGGTGKTFDWRLAAGMKRPCFWPED